ncbi:MAG: dienelactone hydrolase family protein [Acidimicrobiales bacterium]|jgi:carboxymethylenebutenolidase|nr:dienelactone hydrolase family protein [Acidimicrobiales bacterium]HJL98021.1 dienelactone hydrolase family protein [Acidimicrobiales bacterium]
MGTTIQITALDGNTFNAYQADPQGSPKGAVVVVQEIFGVNGHIRSVADGYAERGYVAIAPALFDRVQAEVELGYDESGIDVGRKIAFEDVTMDEVMADIEAACDAVSAAGKIGIVGYCWGGSICYVAAARLSDKISAASGYYGGQIMPHIEEEPKTPLILHFGAQDAGIPLENVDAIAERWPNIDVHIYEEAGHGFNCDARGSYDASSAAVALERTLNHFAQHVDSD